MKALPLDKPASECGKMTVLQVIETVAADVWSGLTKGRPILANLIEYNDLKHTAYIMLCERPTTRWLFLKYALWRAYMPVGSVKRCKHSATRKPEWGCLYFPVPDSVYENPERFRRVWGFPLSIYDMFRNDTTKRLRKLGLYYEKQKSA